MHIDPPSPNPSQRNYRSPIADPYFWAISAIGIIAAFLRFYDLGSDSIWGDEAATWWQSRDTFADLITRTAKDNYPPLYNILVWICVRVFGDAEWSLRLAAALLGTTNVLAIYWVGKLFGGRLVGIFAAILLCLSGFHIAYSQEARMYTLLACMATLFAGTSLRLVQTPSMKWIVLSTLAGVGLLYSHLYGALTWAAIAFAFAVLLLIEPPGRTLSFSRFLRLQIFSFALFSPWAFILLHRALVIGDKGFWIPEITSYRILSAVISVSSGVTTLCILVAGLLFAYWPQKRLRLRPHAGGSHEPESAPEARIHALWILSLWAAGPIAAGIIISILTIPIFIPRYLIGSLPAILILASIGFARFATSRRTLVAAVTVVLVAGLTSSMFGERSSERPDWRSVGHWMKAHLDRDDCVVTYRTERRALIFYYRGDLPCLMKVQSVPVDEIRARRIISDRVFIIFLERDKKAHELIEHEVIEPLSHTRSDKKVFRFKDVRVIRLAKGQT